MLGDQRILHSSEISVLSRDALRAYALAFLHQKSVCPNDVVGMRAALSRYLQQNGARMCECCPLSACVSRETGKALLAARVSVWHQL